MTDALAIRPAGLPNIASAQLPATYERAKEALATCESIDECKDWADKAAALASYAKQADDQTLHRLATRISSRAIRRAGELLQQFQQPKGGDRRSNQSMGDHTLMSQRRAAEAAGLSKNQEAQAVRVANVPTEEFEAAVEGDDPPTVTQLAAMGTKTQPRPPAPAKFPEATHVIAVLRSLAAFCGANEAAAVAAAVLSHEATPLRTHAAVIDAWLRDFLAHLPEATC